HSQGHETMLRRARHNIDHCVSLVRRSCDIEKNQFISALFIIDDGTFNWITGIAQLEKTGSFNHASCSYIQTWDYSLCEHLRTPKMICLRAFDGSDSLKLSEKLKYIADFC